MKEAIIISATESVPSEWVDDFVKEVDHEDFKVKKIVAEDLGLMAAIEWAIPTLVIAYLLKPFFESFLSEAGKDVYIHAKASLKQLINRNMKIKVTLHAATQSIHKLSKNYDQSLSVSVKARVHERLTITVLFDENVAEEEVSQMMDGMFQSLEMLYEQWQKAYPESGDANEGFSRNEIYMIVNNVTKRWELLTKQQMSAKYRNVVTLDDLNKVKNNEKDKSKPQPLKMAEVFISYSWDSPEHEQKVVNLTNHLRGKGFNTTIDKMISQEKTAINFVRMMHQALLEHPKVIVILSKGYKQKAETFTGGVGEEYEILINDIKKNERKYILASFEGRGDNIVPIGLKGRDIVDLSNPEEEKRLLEKMLDHQRYQFVEVADKKPELPTIAPQPFMAPIPMALDECEEQPAVLELLLEPIFGIKGTDQDTAVFIEEAFYLLKKAKQQYMRVDFVGEKTLKDHLNKVNKEEKTSANRKQAIDLKKVLDKLEELRQELIQKVAIMFYMDRYPISDDYVRLAKSLREVLLITITPDQLYEETEITSFIPGAPDKSEPAKTKGKTKVEIFGDMSGKIGCPIWLTQTELDNLIAGRMRPDQIQNMWFYGFECSDLSIDTLTEKAIPSFIDKIYEYKLESYRIDSNDNSSWTHFTSYKITLG